MSTGHDSDPRAPTDIPAEAAAPPCLHPDCQPAFTVEEPAELSSCIVLSSPHSGDVYPQRFLSSARLDPTSLRRSEDAFVDRLFGDAVGLGMPLLRARFARAFLDVNREPYELDPRMFDGRLPPFVNSRSLRVAGGLGTIARVVGEAQEIYAKRLTVEEGIGRIEQFYKPYHAALQALLARTQSRFGQVLLVDCHSMPSQQALIQGGGRPDDRLRADFVIGDRYGTSCDGAVTELVEQRLRGFGYRVERNKPYAGGFITEHYGRPALRQHALQIEVNRGLYMDERALRPSPAFERVATHLLHVLHGLASLTRLPLDGTAVAAE